MKRIFWMLLLSILLVGCESNSKIEYKTISADIGSSMLENSDIYLIDVRTVDEYNERHIENAINIPVDELKQRIKDIVNNKDDVIIVYCQSGVRAQTASEYLIELGYTNVNNMGGINNWPY